MDNFAADCLVLAEEKLAAGKIDRRAFMKIATLLGAAGPVALSSGEARAASEIVFCTWGGDATTHYKKAYAEPFEKATGIKVAFDGTGPSVGKIRAMMDAKKVSWDVMDTTLGVAIELGPLGMLEKIDYSIVDKNKVLPGLANEYGVAGYIYSTLIVYDTTKFPGKKPQTWADFWNVKEFPGKRSFRRDLPAVLEAALLADGVPRDKLYPIDVPRAFKKVQEIKKDCIFWSTGSESQANLRDGETVMGTLWNTRATGLIEDGKGRFAPSWDGAIVQSNAWGVPKGNPAGKDVMKLIASMQDPGQQIELLRLLGNGPVNPAAAAQVPAELKARNPSDPSHLAVSVLADNAWYAANQTTLTPKLLDLLAS